MVKGVSLVLESLRPHLFALNAGINSNPSDLGHLVLLFF